MGFRRIEIGLTHAFPRHRRCDRCDLPLQCSEYNNTGLVYSVNTSPLSGFICVRCAGTKSPKGNVRVTVNDMDQYLQKLLGLKK